VLVAIGSDHAGFDLKQAVSRERGRLRHDVAAFERARPTQERA